MSDIRQRRAVAASRLRTAREMAGLSQAQAAKLLGLHRPTVTEIEAGRRKVASDELTAFAELYGVSVSWLCGEKAEAVDAERDQIELAARELAKLSPKDLKRLLELVAILGRGRR